MLEQVRMLVKNFSEGDKPYLLVLLGPTASGKTALSLELAQEFNGEIISADSRQVYRHMNIGTDKILPEQQKGVPHYLIDVADPAERFTAADFKRLAEAQIDEILSRGKLPMLVGGTGLYLRAITENFALPPENRELRAQIYEELKKDGAEALHKKLQALDPASAAKIHPQNTPYLTRALEIAMSTGRPKHDQKNPPKYRVLKIGLSWPHVLREKLFERIEKRVDEQIRRGLIDEVKGLLAMGYSPDLTSMRTLGYREIIQHLNGEISSEQAVALIKQNTRNFAKRQITWWKKELDIHWITMS